MATTLLAALLLCGVIQGVPAPSTSAAPAEKFKLFLGPLPDKEGFVNTNKAFQDSYRDMAKAYRSDKALQSVLALVTNRDEADLVLEITFRNTPFLPVNSQLRATLFVVRSEFKVDMDGRTGLTVVRFGNQAKGILRQTVVWINANRAACEKVRASRAPKDAVP